jgi:hypothetical protein
MVKPTSFCVFEVLQTDKTTSVCISEAMLKLEWCAILT